MTTFLRLLSDKDKEAELKAVISAQRTGGQGDGRRFEVAPTSFGQIPGAPFAYWVSDTVRETFRRLPAFEGEGRTVKIGMKTGDDFRFLRLWWEPIADELGWVVYAKGGKAQKFYASFPISVNWANNGKEIKEFVANRMVEMFGKPNWEFWISNSDFFFKPALTWPLRASSYSPQALPRNCIFSVRGYAVIAPEDDLLELLALGASSPFDYLFKLMLGRFGFPEFIVGVLKQVPLPIRQSQGTGLLADLAHRAWSLNRTLDTVTETSHAFLLPAALRARLGNFDPPAIEAELTQIQSEIDAIAFDLYGFSEADRLAAMDANEAADEDEEDEGAAEAPSTDTLLSWAVAVAFGRFDWRLATGEREAPPEPEPFDPLPVKSPGMLPDGAEPFHAHPGILVDDPGHAHDLAHLIEEVLERVDMPVPGDLRRWLQREFFPFHLQRYSKSRRKAPIYWPLSTPSGSYTLWIYYLSLTSQTLYTAINDFLDGPNGKLKQVGDETAALRNKGTARTRAEEKQFEELQSFELELIELRNTLLKIAQNYHPNHDDGVQITAAPPWSLFRHKPWQKVLKDTWAKLEKGDYDWAHSAMNYWPDRVREKCKTDKSLAIAHGLEELYEEPPDQPKKKRRQE